MLFRSKRKLSHPDEAPAAEASSTNHAEESVIHGHNEETEVQRANVIALEIQTSRLESDVRNAVHEEQAEHSAKMLEISSTLSSMMSDMNRATRSVEPAVRSIGK